MPSDKNPVQMDPARIRQLLAIEREARKFAECAAHFEDRSLDPLREALESRGAAGVPEHDHGCNVHYYAGAKCTCGVDLPDGAKR